MENMRLYNSLTKRVDTLQPKDASVVRMYHCGPTVYKRQHIGNMRRFLFADFLRRALEYTGFTVKEITNITDVGHLTQDEIDAGEDKVARAAQEEQLTPQMLADRELVHFQEDLRRLHIQPSHEYPRATDHIPHMQALITKLLENGHAYETDTGVYYDVQSFPAYGTLSGNTVESLVAGYRVAVDTGKRHPADFALWIKDTTQLQRWDSPWGEGYPGWHIECSAMSHEYLGMDIDIHTGGEDNRFPHHENEIAQSEGALGGRFVQLWLHNAHLQFKGEKLSKRAGAQITLSTLEERGYDPLAFRILVFGSHYRTPMDFSWELLDGAMANIRELTQLARRLHERAIVAQLSQETPDGASTTRFATALADDLNTPAALALYWEAVRLLNAALDSEATEQIRTHAATLLRLDTVVGILTPLLEQLADSPTLPPDIQSLVTKREEAKQARDYAHADALRAEIAAAGYVIEDTPQGPRVYPQS